MGTVVIGTDTFNIYGSVAGATSYMNGAHRSAIQQVAGARTRR
jgi:hypothetical protein